MTISFATCRVSAFLGLGEKMANRIELLAFAAETLKFTAVPSGLLELLPAERREKIDQFVGNTSRSLAKLAGFALITAVVVQVAVILIGWQAEIIGLLIFIFARLIYTYSSLSDPTSMVGHPSSLILMFLLAL